jgi:hypothetical protein
MTEGPKSFICKVLHSLFYTSRHCLFKCTKKLAIQWKFFSSEGVEHRTCHWGHETERGQSVMGRLFVCS